MSNPVITAVTPQAATIPWAGEVEFAVAATDADARTEQVTVRVRDAAGNESQPATVPVTFLDPLHAVVTLPAGSTATVVPHPVDPLKFTIRNT